MIKPLYSIHYLFIFKEHQKLQHKLDKMMFSESVNLYFVESKKIGKKPTFKSQHNHNNSKQKLYRSDLSFTKGFRL